MGVSQFFLLFTFLSVSICEASTRESHSQRCRTTNDLGRIPWFLPNSTFHNFGFPLIRALCVDNSHGTEGLGCSRLEPNKYLYESVRELRSGNRSSTIIVDPHFMEGPTSESSGTYVIMAMFELLYGLDYNVGVRHWSDAMSGMFPEHIAAAASTLSHRYEAYEHGKGENPFANTPNHILLQIEVPYGFKASVPVNPSPYARTFRWIIGVHYSHEHEVYKLSDPTSHCTAANFQQALGRMCVTSGVIPCPQYQFHRTRSLEVTPETRKTMKKNIILLDADQEDIDMERLKTDVMKLGGLADLLVYKNKGRKKTDMPDFYKTVKMTIDCRNPGVEFINYEATLYDVMTLSCDMRATRNIFDFPVPSKYHFDPSNWTQLVHLVHDTMVNYEQRIDDFKYFKRVSRTSSQLAQTQVDINYFSRDVMFRTHCASYAECRRVYPWAVAVWTLYPLAMIEVVVSVDLQQVLLDSDFVLLTLPTLFTSTHFRMYNSVPGVAPVDMFPRAPCAYMVYMDASFIPFGRDFLNTHVAALVKDPRPILYWQGDKKLAIAVMHAPPYMKLFTAGTKTIYVEIDHKYHAIGNFDTYQDLLKVCPGAEAVGADYLTKMQAGEDFYQNHLTELLKKYPPLSSVPCDKRSSLSAASPQGTVHRTLSSSSSSASTTAPTTTTSSGVLHHRPAALKHSHQTVPHQAQPRNQADRGSYHACAPSEHLIIDAAYIPMPIVGDRASTQGPSIWLTSSLTPISFKTVFATFSKRQIRNIVQHLDPILQNPNMLKILPFIPSDIADALRQFDAINYPTVISMRDMEYPYWGEECA